MSQTSIVTLADNELWERNGRRWYRSRVGLIIRIRYYSSDQKSCKLWLQWLQFDKFLKGLVTSLALCSQKQEILMMGWIALQLLWSGLKAEASRNLLSILLFQSSVGKLPGLSDCFCTPMRGLRWLIHFILNSYYNENHITSTITCVIRVGLIVMRR